MRIINQRGNWSFNFDDLEISTDDTEIYANNGKSTFLIAQYETEERAKEVFEEIHNAYSRVPIAFHNVDIDDSVIKMLEKMKKEAIVVKTNGEPSIEKLGEIVFKMPTN